MTQWHTTKHWARSRCKFSGTRQNFGWIS